MENKLLKQYTRKIYKNRLKKYLSDKNAMYQACIIQFETIKQAFDYCNIYNYDNFKNYVDMFSYYDKYIFCHENKVYFILFDLALDVYRK